MDLKEPKRTMSFEHVDDPDTITANQNVDLTNQKAKSNMKTEMKEFLNAIKSTFPEKMKNKDVLYKSYIALFSTENVVFKDSNEHRMTGDWTDLWNEAFNDVMNQTFLDKINPFNKRQRRGGTKYKLKNSKKVKVKKTKRKR